MPRRRDWWATTQGRVPDYLPERGATLTVAAVDADLASRQAADFLCDGVNDDVDILAAINALPSVGGRVLLSEGTFTLGSRITVSSKSNLVLEGQGLSTVLKRVAGATPGLGGQFTFQDCDKIVVRDIQWDGNRANVTGLSGDNGETGLQFNSCRDFSLLNCWFKDWTADGFAVGTHTESATNTLRGYIANVTCDNCRRNGSSLTASGTLTVQDVVYVGCRFINANGTSPQAGFDIEPNQATNVIKDIQFIGCTFSGNTKDGFVCNNAIVADVERVVLSGCTFRSNSNYGLQANTVDYLTVTDCHAQGNTAASRMAYYLLACTQSIVKGCTTNGDTQGIRVDGGSNISVVSNVLNSGAGSATDIDVVSAAVDILVAMNHCTRGITVQGTANRVTVRDNTVLRNAAGAINIVAGVTNAIVAGNRLTGASGTITDAGTGTVQRDVVYDP